MDINKFVSKELKKLAQTNTFTGGMNTDTSDALLSPELYRFAKNLRLTTDSDSNTGELHMIEGNINQYSVGSSEEIIAATSIRKYGVFVVLELCYYVTIENDVWYEQVPDGAIYITHDVLGVYNNTYYTTQELENVFEDLPPALDDVLWYAYSEDAHYYKVYNVNCAARWYIKRFNLNRNEIDILFGPCTTTIADNFTNKLCLLTRYESDNNIKLYIADGEYLIMQLNIAEVPLTVETDIKYLVGYTNVMLDTLAVEVSTDAGMLYPAKVLYCYRMYAKKGAATRISPLTKTLSLYKTANSGYASTERSGRSVNIFLPGTTYLGLDYIQIFRITYRENGLAPEIHLIADQKYVPTGLGEPSVIIDSGANNIRTVAVSEFLSYYDVGIIPKSIESKNDYLFAANVKYKLDEVDSLFDKNIAKTETYTPQEVYHNTLGGNLYFEWRWIYDDASTNGQYTIDENNQATTYRFLTSCFRPGETYRFGIVFYDEDGNASSVRHMQDIKVPNYGDLERAYPNDLMITINNSGSLHFNGGIFSPSYTIKPLKLYVELRQEIPHCSKWEVVRCIRTTNDKHTISQGIIGHPLLMYTLDYSTSGGVTTYTQDPTDKICPSGFLTLDYMIVHNGTSTSYANTNVKYIAKPALNLLLFASPEYSFLKDDVKQLLLANAGNLTINEVLRFFCLTHSQELSVGEEVYKSVRSIASNTQLFNDIAFRFNFINYYLNSNYLVYSRYTENCNRLLQYNRNGKIGYISFNYIQPYSVDTSGFSAITSNITKLAYPKVPEYNDLSTDETLRFLDDVTQIGLYLFIGWSAPLLLDSSIGKESTLAKLWRGESNRDEDPWGSFYGTGTTGSCILMELQNPPSSLRYSLVLASEISLEYVTGYFTISVANLTKPATPYGGPSDEALKSSVYYSFGCVYDNVVDSGGKQVGDCYVRLFQYNALHNWFDTTYVCPTKMGTVYSVPILSDIDLQGQYGHPFNSSDNKAYYIQDTPASFDGYTQTNSAYMYNTAYNAHPDIIAHTAYGKEKGDSNVFDTRVHYSEQKINGEEIDNWLLFKSNNFLDVDSRYGEITNLRLFKDKLIFWLNNATGLLAVNERIILQDANDAQVVLGTGSVLERYDYFTTIYGMKPNLMADAQSNESLYWWDGYNKEILQYTDKYAVIPLSTVKFVKNYLNANTENTSPHLVYDNKYKEIIVNCVHNESIIYNEAIQAFTGIYSFVPQFSFTINNILYTGNSAGFYKQDFIDTNNGAKLFGTDITPYLKYVVNADSLYVKTFDTQTMGGRFYKGSTVENGSTATVDKVQNLTYTWHSSFENAAPLYHLSLIYSTPLKQLGKIQHGQGITNREYDYRLNVPRQGKIVNNNWVTEEYGDRLRGKTMQCELESDSNSTDFSLQYITTKYRMSWS